MPYWIVLVALVLYGLSAPHTAGVFDKLTPGWGFIAPIGVEFGLLYAAFRRSLAKTEGQLLPWTLWALVALLFLTVMLVNGAGSFSSVIDVIQLQRLSFSAIVEEFGLRCYQPSRADYGIAVGLHHPHWCVGCRKGIGGVSLRTTEWSSPPLIFDFDPSYLLGDLERIFDLRAI